MAEQSIEAAPTVSSRRLFFWLAAVGLILRLVYFSEHSRSGFFNVPVLDEKFYDSMARGLLEGQAIAELNPGFRTLFYPAFLALCYGLGEPFGYELALVAQHLLGLATGLLVAALALRLFGSLTAAATAGLLFFLAGPPLYFEGELLVETLFTFLTTVFLLALTRCRFDGQLRPFVWTGLALALACQARPTLLPVAFAFPIVALLSRCGDARARAVRVGVAWLALFIGLGVAGLIQRPWLGEWVVLPSAGGINLYLGNKIGADGMIPRQDRATTYGEGYQDTVQVFALETFREQVGREPRNSNELSSYWVERTLGEVVADPAAWLGLMARKLTFLVWNHEIPNNKSYAFARAFESRLLGYLPIGFGLLLALAGIAAYLRRLTPETLWLWVFAVAFGGGIVLFFVNARYRLPLWPALAVLAAPAPVALFATWRQDRRRAGQALALGFGLLVLSSVNWWRVPQQDFARDYFFRSVAFFEKGMIAEARADAEAAVRLAPDQAPHYFQLGSVALEQGETATAISSFSRASELFPREGRIFNNLGVAYEKAGKLNEAYAAYVSATMFGPDLGAAWVNAALLELRAGQVDQAHGRLEHAAHLGFSSTSFDCARAFVLLARGRAAEGEAWLARLAERDPETVARLVSEQARPLKASILPKERVSNLPR